MPSKPKYVRVQEVRARVNEGTASTAERIAWVRHHYWREQWIEWCQQDVRVEEVDRRAARFAFPADNHVHLRYIYARAHARGRHYERGLTWGPWLPCRTETPDNLIDD